MLGASLTTTESSVGPKLQGGAGTNLYFESVHFGAAESGIHGEQECIAPLTCYKRQRLLHDVIFVKSALLQSGFFQPIEIEAWQLVGANPAQLSSPMTLTALSATVNGLK